MSWLLIDSAESGHIRIGFLSSMRVRVWMIRGRSRSLLRVIAMRASLSMIRKGDGICVVHGPGSFSSVRSGVLVANLLARLLRKPLVGVHRADAEDLARLAHRLESGEISTSSTVMPTYDAEPNITLSSCTP